LSRRSALLDSAGYSEIIAPFSGTIITNHRPGTLAVPGAPLFTIERDGPSARGFRGGVSAFRGRVGKNGLSHDRRD